MGRHTSVAFTGMRERTVKHACHADDTVHFACGLRIYSGCEVVRLSKNSQATSAKNILGCAVFLWVAAGILRAQTANVIFPEAPSPASAGSSWQDAPAESKRPITASNHAKFIFPGQTAPHLTATDKVNMGLIHGISLYSAAGWVVASEYVHLIDGAPNYGTNLGAYGQRLGAAALRGYSEEVLGTSILSPLLHEDPRFFRMGPRRGIAARTLYAVTRTVVTRDDNGGQTLNLSLLGGNLTGAALTNAYYPAANRSAGQTLRTFGGSMGGAAFGFVADEFLPDKLLSRTMVAVHLRRR